MESANPDIGEQVLSKAAEVGISSQLDGAEMIDVDLRTDPGKVMQGKLDSVAISGQGLVMQQELRMASLKVHTGQVAINPLSAMLGKIELTYPTDADAEIILNESDLNRALCSDFIKEKLQNLEMDLDGRSAKVDIQKVNLTLPGENKVDINADFLIEGEGGTKQLSAVVIPHVAEGGSQVRLEVISAEGQGLDNKLLGIILQQITALLDLKSFDIPDMTLNLEQLEAQKGQLLLRAKTRIEQFQSQ